MASHAVQITETAAGPPTGEVVTDPRQHKKIARLAYSYWEARGCPLGSPEEDWFRAEEEIRRQKSTWKLVKARRRHLPRARMSSRSRKSAG